MDAIHREVNLKFMWDHNNPTKNNYDVLLLLHQPGQIFNHDEHSFVCPSPTSLQLIMKDYADEAM